MKGPGGNAGPFLFRSFLAIIYPMELVLKAPKRDPRKMIRLLFSAVFLGAILLGVAWGVKTLISREVPLKPCATCVSCACPTGLSGGIRCGCSR